MPPNTTTLSFDPVVGTAIADPPLESNRLLGSVTDPSIATRPVNGKVFGATINPLSVDQDEQWDTHPLTRENASSPERVRRTILSTATRFVNDARIITEEVQSKQIIARAPPQTMSFRANFTEAPLANAGLDPRENLMAASLAPLATLNGRSKGGRLVGIQTRRPLLANQPKKVPKVDTTIEVIPWARPVLPRSSWQPQETSDDQRRPFQPDV